jgi:Tfp pilus assembly protein PilO
MSMTDRDKKILMALIPLVLIGVYWFLLLSPKRHEATRLTDQVTEAQQARDAAVAQAQQLAKAKAQFPTQYAQMVRLGKALPTRVDMPSLLVQLSAAAAGTHIKFGSITVGDRVTAPLPTPVSTTSAGGSATVFGADVQKAKAANAAESSSAAQSSAASNNVGTTGATGASSPTGTSNAPGLDEVPLSFKFGGQFTDLADFFHRLKRFVRVANDAISVQGRLITIDSLKFSSTNFPALEADVSATIYLTPKNDPTSAAGTTGPQAAQSAAIAAVSSTPPSSSPGSSSSGSGNTQ